MVGSAHPTRSCPRHVFPLVVRNFDRSDIVAREWNHVVPANVRHESTVDDRLRILCSVSRGDGDDLVAHARFRLAPQVPAPFLGKRQHGKDVGSTSHIIRPRPST